MYTVNASKDKQKCKLDDVVGETAETLLLVLNAENLDK